VHFPNQDILFVSDIVYLWISKQTFFAFVAVASVLCQWKNNPILHTQTVDRREERISKSSCFKFLTNTNGAAVTARSVGN